MVGTQLSQPSRGFIYVASLTRPYFDAAIQSADSIKDFWPDAKITLFTHKDWWDEKYRDIFDNVILDIPVHCRAKLWALERTPYDLTCFMDADTFCESEDIRHIFDQLEHDDEYDMAMTCNRPYNAKVVYFTNDKELRHWKEPDKSMIKDAVVHKWEGDKGVYRFKWHCGMFLYKNNERTLKMLNMWYQNYAEQIEMNPNKNWGYPYPKTLWFWDTFAFWRTNFDVDYQVNIKEIHAKWNYVSGYRDAEELDDENQKVFWHYTIPKKKIDNEQLEHPKITNSIGRFDVFR